MSAAGKRPSAYADAAIQRISAGNGIEHAYRDLGDGDVPLVLLQHFRGQPRQLGPALDELAANRRVVPFDNVAVGATTGTTPSTVEAMAHDALALLEAMDVQRVDLLGLSSAASLRRRSHSFVSNRGNANALLGRPLRWSSVKGILSAYAIGGDRRFHRIRHGLYELRR